MRVLLVEDTQAAADDLVRFVGRADIKFVHVRTRSDAEGALHPSEFDLIVIDLSIPAAHGSLEDDPAHGIAVYKAARNRCPGTPVVLYSAYGASVIDELGDLLVDEPSRDYLGVGAKPMVIHRSKGRITELVAQLQEHSAQLRALATAADISWAGGRLELELLEERVLRLQARRYDARVVEVKALAGGRSQARTLLLGLRGPGDERLGTFVAKLNTIEGAVDERERYERFVRPHLPAGSYTNFVEELLAGAGDRGALFYAVAPGSADSVFELLPESDTGAARVVRELRESCTPWDSAARAKERTVGDVLSDLATSDRLVHTQVEVPSEWVSSGLDALPVAARVGPMHGDLHAGNVLVTPAGSGLIIDFGSCAVGSRALDPVSFELSPLLHADAKPLGEWPSLEQAHDWCDLETYVDGCPFPEFIRACRSWLDSVKRADREQFAAVYAYSRLQLTFPSVTEGRRSEVAIALAQGAVDRLLS